MIEAKGHPNIRATHGTTVEITKEKHVTVRGDCVIAVAASKAAQDLHPDFKRALQTSGARVLIEIVAGSEREAIKAFGSPKLTLEHPTDLVVRKSDYVCERTLAIKADKAACDLSRSLLPYLKDPHRKVTITITVEV